MTAPLDRIDRRLLALLQDDARLTVAELAERVSLSTSPCWRRIRRLEEAGYIAGYHARLSPEQRPTCAHITGIVGPRRICRPEQ